MDIYAPRNPGKIFLGIFLAIIGATIGVVGFTVDMTQSMFSASVVSGLLLLGTAAWAFISYFSLEVVLHADEAGVFTMYQFYLPWKHIDKFYIRETEEGNVFLEIKVKDDKKYLEEMDHDLYSIYYDEMELAALHGHELFYFPVSYMDLDGDEVLKFFEDAKKKYEK